MPNGQSDRGHAHKRPPTARMVRCPECHGTGETDTLNYNGQCTECGCLAYPCMGWHDCPLCTGEGVVTASAAKVYREAIEKGRTRA